MTLAAHLCAMGHGEIIGYVVRTRLLPEPVHFQRSQVRHSGRPHRCTRRRHREFNFLRLRSSLQIMGGTYRNGTEVSRTENGKNALCDGDLSDTYGKVRTKPIRPLPPPALLTISVRSQHSIR